MLKVRDFLFLIPTAVLFTLVVGFGYRELFFALLAVPGIGVGMIVYRYYEAFAYAVLCETVACVNRARKKQPGQPGYIDEAEILTQPIPTTINKIGVSVCSAEDVASEKSSETTGAPMFVYTVLSRILATGIVAAKRMGKRAQGIAADAPDDDSDGTDAGEPVTVEPYPAALEPV